MIFLIAIIEIISILVYLIMLVLMKFFLILKKRRIHMWTKPTATDLRFGFEITMYVAAK